MSSIASASDHIDHVRTQAPYAIVTMLVSIFAGYLPSTYTSISPWLCMAIGVAVLAGLLFMRGKHAGGPAAA